MKAKSVNLIKYWSLFKTTRSPQFKVLLTVCKSLIKSVTQTVATQDILNLMTLESASLNQEYVEIKANAQP